MSQRSRRGCAPLAIPVLETERLVLRGFEAGDVEALCAIHANPSAARFLGITDISLPETHRTLQGYLGHWALNGHGKWAVVDKASGLVVGRTGYSDYPFDWPGLELGWTFGAASWGKGYATEAAAAALTWGFDVLGAEQIVSMIDPENTASQAVARRLGATSGPIFRFHEVDHVLWVSTPNGRRD